MAKHARGADDMTDWASARSFIGLKFRILARTPQARAGLVLGGLFGGFLTLVASIGIWALRNSDNAELALAIALSALSAGWFLGPLVLGGGEVILDVRRFGPLPLCRSTLAAGTFLASFVGIPALATTVIALATVTHADSFLGGVVVVASAVAFVTTTILASRVVISFVSLMFGSRFRAAATAVTVLVAVSMGAASQSFVLLSEWLTIGRLERIRLIVRWLPTSWPAEALALAANDQLAMALVFLAASAVLIITLAVAWGRLLARHMDGEGAQDLTRRKGPLVPAWMDAVVSRRTAAAWARANRSMRRDPREWAETAAFIPLVVAFSVPAVTVIQSATPNLMLVSYLAASSSVAIITSNLFGSDGPSFVAEAFPGDCFRSVLVGKTLPRLVIVLVLVVTGTLVLASMSGGWSMLPVALVLIAQSALVAATAGIFISLRSPIPMPDRVGSLSGGSNAGCVASLLRVITLAAINLATTIWAAPALIFALLDRPLMALVPGLFLLAAAVWWFRWTTEIEGQRMANRVPELLDALSLGS